MATYHFTKDNIRLCELDQKRVEKILRERFSAYDVNGLCYWAGVRETFGVNFKTWNSQIRAIEIEEGSHARYHEIPEVYRDFLEQFLAYYNPVVDLDVDDEECI